MINTQIFEEAFINKAMLKNFYGVNPCSEIKLGRKMENTNWNFKSAADADINWKDIKNSLSYAEPLALVTRNYKDYPDVDKYVVVSKELANKAHRVGMLKDSPEIITSIEKRVFSIITNFSEWVDWAKDVKAASWPDPLKSNINVVLPTV